MKKIIVLIVVAILAFGIGLTIGIRYYKIPQLDNVLDTVGAENYVVDNTDFVPANVSLNGVTVQLSNNCLGISFDVTTDQAYSISRILDKEPSARPLTQDIFLDVVDNFNLSLRSVRIERYADEIYYARMFVQQGNRILDMDVRPSDAIALALRTNNNLLINDTMLKEKGTNICNS